VVELKGALGNPARGRKPQLYGLDTDATAIRRSYDVLESFGLADYALLYQGAIDTFVSDFSIGPTMVFVDADHRYEGVKRDLDGLSRLLAPGVPVFCHDYANREDPAGEIGVRRAATEWEESGHARCVGAFGAGALFVTTERCGGTTARMSDEAFAQRRRELLRSYGVLA
jgi:hypothetical protein